MASRRRRGSRRGPETGDAHLPTHSHTHAPAPVAPAVARRLVMAVVPFAVAALVGVGLLWPSGEAPADVEAGPPPEQYEAVVSGVERTECPELPQGESFRCYVISATIEEGPDSGREVSFDFMAGTGVRVFQEGDGIFMSRSPDAAGEPQYFFVDQQRGRPLWLLGILFAAVVVGLSRWRGLAALGGLGISVLVLVMFILPAILEGKNPLAVAVTGSAVIMFVTLYMAHGANTRTTTAVLGTMASLLLTGILAYAFVAATRITGLSSEEASFLQVSAGQVNLTGLLLGGIIIGALGVLDDVTITQASAVWELHAADPVAGPRQLFASALRIGRDHIASTVNTLVLAYAGASLPLLVLFSLSQRPVAGLLTSEVIAEELVRTFVGSIGLVASVPITTGLAVLAVYGSFGRRERRRRERRGRPQWRPPRAEREWRDPVETPPVEDRP